MTTGEKIRKARTAVGITQKGLAQRVGVSEQAVGRWESGWRNPSEESLRRICEALRVKPESLLPDGCAACRQTEMKPTVPEQNRLPLNGLSDDETELIVSYRKLSPASKNLLAEIAKTFIRKT